MKTKQALVPKLRFAKFKTEWETTTISDIAKVSSGGTPSRSNSSYWGGNIPWVTTTQIDFNTIKSALQFITEEGVKKSAAKLLSAGTLLMALYGQGKTRGKVAILGLDAATNQACASICLNENIALIRFVFLDLQRRYEEIRDLSNDGGQKNLSGQLVKSLTVSTPTLPEQEKIAAFLTSVDDRIDQLKRKKSLLQDYKKGVMQKLFSQELRFKDDHGIPYPDWEEKKLGEVLSIGSGKDYKHLNKGGIPVYGSGGIMTYVDQFLYDGESVCIGRKGTIDKPQFRSGKFWTVDTLFYTHSFKGVVPKFILSIFQNIKWYRYNEASGVPSLSKGTIEKIPITIPSLPEQTKIANFLSTLDQKIEQIDTQITLTQTFKKGLLQQMFI